MVYSRHRSATVLRFGECELSSRERQLFLRGRPVAIQARPLDLLIHLIENRDRVVAREELLAKVWKGVRVNEQALRFALHAVRRAIGDSGHKQRIVRTVRGTGLQFVGRVESVERRTRHSARKDRLDHSFLARESFSEILERAFSDVDSGRGRTLLVAGEPGIGKTTALQRAASLASDRGLSVGYARCLGADEASAVSAWTEAIRRLVDGELHDRVSKALVDGAEEVAWVVPEFADRIEGGVASPSSDSRASRERLIAAISTFLKRLSASTPIALLIDDLHQADGVSLLIFERLASILAGSATLLFGTVRSHGNAYERCASMVSSVITLTGAELVTLAGLSPTDIFAIAELHAGVPPSEAAVRCIGDKTNGNPFFVMQILRVLENDGRLGSLSLNLPIEYSIPRGLRDAILRQIEMLPPGVKELLSVASVVEAEFTGASIAAALGRDTAAVLADLDSALRAGICVSDDEGIHYRFAHALVREAICASLSMRERGENHLKIALSLEQLAANSPSPLAADVAGHFGRAFPDGERVRAIRFYIAAARWDTNRAAFEAAAAHIERALGLLERLCPQDVGTRCELLLEQGRAYGLAANRDASRTALSEAFRLAGECKSSDWSAQAALLFAPDLLAIETGVLDRDLVGLLEGALSRLEHSASDWPRILARLAVALHWSDEPRERIGGLVAKAVECAKSTDDPGLIAFVRTAGTLALYSVEDPQASIRGSEPKPAEDGSTALLRTILRITALLQVGRLRDAEIEIQGFSELVASSRKPSAAWYVDMLRATMSLFRGEYTAAADHAESFLKQGMAVDDRNALHSFALQRAMSAIDTGGLEDLEPAIVDMAARFPRVEGWQAGLCYFHSELGRESRASDVMDSAVAKGVLKSFPRNSWLGTLCSLTLACRVVDAPGIVQELYWIWGRFANQMAVVGFSSFCWGSTERFRGVAAGLMGRFEESLDHFDRAISANRGWGAAPALAHTYADRAFILDRKNVGSGRASWDLALERARAMGMRRLEDRILREAF